MLLELRMDALFPGKVREFIGYSGRLGVPIRGEKYGRLEGFWTSDSGASHTVAHLWSHADFQARQQNRLNLNADKAWSEDYMPRITPLVQRQEIRLLTPVRALRAPPSAGGVYELRQTITRAFRVGQWIEGMTAALPAFERHALVAGFWSTIAGRPNEVHVLWHYASPAARSVAQAAIANDGTCREALADLNAMALEEHSILFLPTSFSPLP